MKRFFAEIAKSDFNLHNGIRSGKWKRYDKDHEKKKTFENRLCKPESFDRSKELCICPHHSELHASYDPVPFSIVAMLKLKTDINQLVSTSTNNNVQNCECGKCPHIHYYKDKQKNNNIITRRQQMEFIKHLFFTINYQNYDPAYIFAYGVSKQFMLKNISFFYKVLSTHYICGNCINIILTYNKGITKLFAIFVEMFKVLKNIAVNQTTTPVPHNRGSPLTREQTAKLPDLTEEQMHIYATGYVVSLHVWSQLLTSSQVIRYVLSDFHLFKLFLRTWMETMRLTLSENDSSDEKDNKSKSDSKSIATRLIVATTGDRNNKNGDDDEPEANDFILRTTVGLLRSIRYWNRNHMAFFMSNYYNYYADLISGHVYQSIYFQNCGLCTKYSWFKIC